MYSHHVQSNTFFSHEITIKYLVSIYYIHPAVAASKISGAHDRPHIWQNPRGAGQPCPLPLELDAKPRSFRFKSDHMEHIW